MRAPRSTLFGVFLLTDGQTRVRGFMGSPYLVCAPSNGMPSSAAGLQRTCGATTATTAVTMRHRKRPRRETCCLGRRGKCLAYGTTGKAFDRNGHLRMRCSDPSAELVELEHVLHPSHESSSSAVVADGSSGSTPATSRRAAAAAAAATSPPQPVSDAGDGNEEEQQEEFGGTDVKSTGAGSMVSGMGSAVHGVGVGVIPLKRGVNGGLLIDGQGLLNLCILVFAGLWAVHSVVTVDSTMWRGWTLQETLMRLPWDNWDSYEVGLLEHPIVTKTAINIGIYLIGDWLSQVNWGREEDVQLWDFDLQRTLRNGLIGAIFGPLVHYYYDFSDWILPPNVGTNRPLKIMLDQSIYFVSKCAMYISLVSLLRGDSLEETGDTVKERLKGVVTTGWRFWPFVHVFTYFLIPPRHRVLWVNCVDLLWSSILAGMTSGTPPEEAVEGGEEGSETGGAPS